MMETLGSLWAGFWSNFDPLWGALVFLLPCIALAHRAEERAAASRQPYGGARGRTGGRFQPAALPSSGLGPPGLAETLVALSLGLFVLYAVWYVWTPAYFGHLGAQIVAVSALFARGDAIYHAVDAPERFGLLYGPLAYVIPGTFQRLFGVSLFAAKLPGVLAGLAALGAMFAALARRDRAERWLTVGLFAFLLLLFPFRAVRAKPDPFLVAGVVFALVALRARRPLVGALAFGLLAGIAANLKVHGPLYFLPLFPALVRATGWRGAGIALVTGAATAASVFALPQVSATDYLEALSIGASRPFEEALFLENLKRSAYLSAPALGVLAFGLSNAARRELVMRHGVDVALFVVALAGAWFAGSKAGANWQHQLPLVPYWALATSTLVARARASDPQGDGSPRTQPGSLVTALRNGAACAWLIGGGLQALLPLPTITGSFARAEHASALESELRTISEEHAGLSIQMGYGDTGSYGDTFHRHVLVGLGHPYELDAAALMDWDVGGHPITPATIERLFGGTTDIWLIPRESTPFALRSLYRSPGPVAPRSAHSDEAEGEVEPEPEEDPGLFGAEARAAFAAGYELRDRTEHFELWFQKTP